MAVCIMCIHYDIDYKDYYCGGSMPVCTLISNKRVLTLYGEEADECEDYCETYEEYSRKLDKEGRV